MWNVGWGTLLGVLFLVGCTADPLPLTAPAPAPTVGGDTVGNGGGEWTATVQKIARLDLLEGLERPVNREIIARYFSPAEIRHLLALLENGLAVRVVVPALLEKNQYEDPDGAPAEVEDGRLLDRDRVPVNSRVVRDTRSRRWLIQMDEEFVKRNWDEKERMPSRVLLRQLAHELFRLAYHSQQTKFADDDQELSVELRFKPPYPNLHKEFKIWEGAKKFKLLENGITFGHRRVSVVGQRFEGVVNCGAAPVAAWLPTAGIHVDKNFCYLTLVFEPTPGSATRGKMRHAVESYPDRKKIAENVYDFVEDEEYLEIRFAGGETIAEATLFGDILDFAMTSNVFRVDKNALSVAGAEYKARLFRDTSAYALAINIPDFLFETASDLLTFEEQETVLTFLDDKKMHYKGARFDGATDKIIAIDCEATYEQIGNVVLVNLDGAAPPGESAGAHPNLFYFWLRPGKGGKELVTSTGDSLFRDGKSDIARVGGSYSAYLDCSEVSWLPPEKRSQLEFRREAGMGCAVTVSFRDDGRIEVAQTVHYPQRQDREKILGFYTQLGRHIFSSTLEKSPFQTYKLLPDGQLSDVFDNVYTKNAKK